MASLLGVAYAYTERITAMGRTGLYAFLLVYLIQVYLLVGRLEEAYALAQRALALVRAHQQRGREAYALRLLSEIQAHYDPAQAHQAEAYHRQALALAEEL